MNETATERETFESRDLFRKAERSIKKCDYRAAMAYLEEALKISPENPEYVSFLGLCDGMLGEPEKGSELCRKAILNDPRNPILFVNLGRILLQLGLRQDARDMFIKAYKLDNTNSAAALELARMGVRRKPVLSFLERSHPINVKLGKIRYRLLSYWSDRKLKK